MSLLAKLRDHFSKPATSLQAAAAINTDAKTALDSVEALFTAAGLDLPKLLEAGPDSLKAHLASLDLSADLKAKEQALGEATAKLTDIEAKLTAAEASSKTAADLLSSIGFSVNATADDKPIDIKTSFASHVEKAAATLLAKDGRPPVEHIDPNAGKPEAKASDAELLAQYEKLPAGPDRLAFFAKHEQAIWRAHHQAAR
jgi:hypothetical protein